MSSNAHRLHLVVVVVVTHIYPAVTVQLQDANLLDDPHTFRCLDYFMLEGIRTCLGVSDDPMFLWISSNFCPLKFAACLKPPSRDNHCKASYPRTQSCDQGVG